MLFLAPNHLNLKITTLSTVPPKVGDSGVSLLLLLLLCCRFDWGSVFSEVRFGGRGAHGCALLIIEIYKMPHGTYG